MAITKSITTAQGFIATDAYIKITTFMGYKGSIQLNVDVYKDQQASIDNLQVVASHVIGITLLNGATMQQMYDALKLLPEFSGAIDA